MKLLLLLLIIIIECLNNDKEKQSTITTFDSSNATNAPTETDKKIQYDEIPTIKQYSNNNYQNNNSPQTGDSIISKVEFEPSKIVPNQNFASICHCSNMKCPPCGVVNINFPSTFIHNFNSNQPYLICPCAPKLICKPCPPISLIHELALRKASNDEKLSFELKNLSNTITQIMSKVTKFAGEVFKYETESKELAIKMEESRLKAQIARREMEKTSEKARIIAKSSLTNCIDCLPKDIDMNNIINNDVFPEETNSINDLMKGNFSTNMNSFDFGQSNLPMDNIQDSLKVTEIIRTNTTPDQSNNKKVTNLK